MTDADTQQRQAGMQAETWAGAFLYKMRKDNNLRDEPIDMDAFDDKIEFSEQVFSAKLIAAGLDEVAMSLRMIAETVVDESAVSMVASSLDGIAEKLGTDEDKEDSPEKEPFKPTKY
jgi:pyruvate-formate lyase